ncbi:unnamed protein product, partial [Ascophyllum nodosum]
VGDWTEELFRLSLKNPQMPLWITTAQPSVLERTSYYDNDLDDLESDPRMHGYWHHPRRLCDRKDGKKKERPLAVAISRGGHDCDVREAGAPCPKHDPPYGQAKQRHEAKD